MKRQLETLKQASFETVVIGGGITGACLAHDLALRGRKVALVEQNDFGGFTSSASSRLIHGGIRYLPKIQFHKVRESAKERAIFQNLAPHLTRYVPFVIPTFKNDFMKSRFALSAGMAVYNCICLGLDKKINDPTKKVPAGRFVSLKDLKAMVPQISHLDQCDGGWILYESHMRNSERMTLAFIKTAVENGTVAANYLQVKDLLKKENRVTGVVVRDRLSGETFRIRARITANASGPFIPALNRRFGKLRLRKEMRGLAKGVHLVTRQIHPSHAIAFTTEKKTEGYITRGGRHIFVIPWEEKSLIGTSNVPFHGQPEHTHVTGEDVLDFLKDINRVLPHAQLEISDVKYAFAGLYPLTAHKIKPDTYQGTGEYQVVDHGKMDGLKGIFSVLGAKYTTARKVAQIAADQMERSLADKRICRTDRVPLAEGRIPTLDRFIQTQRAVYSRLLSPSQIEKMIYTYGAHMDAFMDYAGSQPEGHSPIGSTQSSLCAQVRYAVEHEMALTLTDVMFRRTDLGMYGHPGGAALRQTAGIMGDLLGWSPEKKEKEMDRVSACYDYLHSPSTK